MTLVAAALHDGWIVTKRNLIKIKRIPDLLIFTTIQPIMFVLLFAYVFGGAIGLPGGGSYDEYLIGGMFGMGIAGTTPGTAVALVADMKEGIIDRFRSLPMSRAAVLLGRTTADLLTQVIGGLVIVETLFNYQGIGNLIFKAATSKDFPMLAAGVLTIGVVYMVATLIADVLATALNPRLRLGGAE